MLDAKLGVVLCVVGVLHACGAALGAHDFMETSPNSAGIQRKYAPVCSNYASRLHMDASTVVCTCRRPAHRVWPAAGP